MHFRGDRARKSLEEIFFYTYSFTPSLLHLSLVAHQVAASPRFRSMKRLGVFIFYSPLMGCQSIAGLNPAVNLPIPIYTPKWREALLE